MDPDILPIRPRVLDDLRVDDILDLPLHRLPDLMNMNMSIYVMGGGVTTLTRMSTASACGFAARPSESASLTSGVSHRMRGKFSSGGKTGGLAQALHAPMHPPHWVWPATIT
jgi:hypothetical protein